MGVALTTGSDETPAAAHIDQLYNERYGLSSVWSMDAGAAAARGKPKRGRRPSCTTRVYAWSACAATRCAGNVVTTLHVRRLATINGPSIDTVSAISGAECEILDAVVDVLRLDTCEVRHVVDQ